MPSDWSWWPWFCLRSAGLPADWLLQPGAYQEERFQEAMIWQNRPAWERIQGWLDRHPETHNSRARQHRRSYANYLQRYTMKNDSIGFFGPLAWGQLESGEVLKASPQGEQLCDMRKLFWEPWALQELQRHWSERLQLGEWLRWRKDPTRWLEGQKFYGSPGRADWVAFGPSQRQAWESQVPHPELPKSALRWHPLPLDDRSPDWLQQWLDGLPAELRPQADWDRLRLAFAELEKARGAGPVSQALQQLEAVYEEVAGRPSTRRSGSAYSGRTLVYLSCRRNVEVRLGVGLLERYRGPLDLLVRACRWFCFQVFSAFRRLALSQVARLRARYGSPLRWSRVYPRLAEIWERADLYEPIREELRARMLAALKGDGGELFACPSSGWSSSECHGVDLLWSWHRGQWRAVVGDVHPGINTLGSLECFQTHPCPAALVEPGPARLRPVPLEDFVRCSLDGWERAQDIHVFQENAGASWRPAENQVDSAELWLDDGLSLSWSGSGGRRFDFMQLCESAVQMRAVHFFEPFRCGERLEKDGLILARQRWRCGPEPPAEAPRQFFLRSPAGEKPTYIDRDHPHLEQLFRHLQRRYGEFEIEEVWPPPSHFWLSDAEGRRYSSEIRLTAQFRS